MTAIVGVVDHETVWIGGDSAGTTSSWVQMQRADGKVFRRGPFLIGFTSSFRMGQLLQYSLDAPDSTGLETDIHEFMATKFIDSVRTCLKKGGFAEKENEVEKAGSFLMGYRGRLFHVHSDYQVGESALGFDACGSGWEVAFGSLFTSDPARGRTVTLAANLRVFDALLAAAQFNAAVRPPFKIESL